MMPSLLAIVIVLHIYVYKGDGQQVLTFCRGATKERKRWGASSMNSRISIWA